ncbi:DUF58 domain-containing protein [Imhoffiella purpurea]|uniref:Uncharacterized protein n=1 Tax=Imhoffiella purpurea TaxID=1249627 RepID=W9VUI7_9GAMM|nr:DUF58 domain-containing protein [Imhoffiella purpurea]EXJ14035.1 hypothetical protein D779_3095 [Imhoffiella purpurea]
MTLRERAAARIRRGFEGLLRRVPCDPDGVARVRARQIYILPTRTGMLYASVLMLMLLGSLNYQNNLGLLFTFFLASVGVVAMHHAWFDLLGLAVQIRSGAPVFAGETAQFEVSLRSERPRYDIRVLKDRQGPEPQYIPPGDRRSVHLPLATRSRGPLRLVDLTIETRHPMGLFRAWCHIATDATTLVYPQPAAQAPPPASDAGDERRPHRHRGEGAEDYQGSRGYRPGDSPRHVDWKAFARERGLQVKLYAGDQGQEIWLDWSHLGATDTETRLSLLARQVLDAAGARIRFGLRLPGAVEGLDRGAAHTQRCLSRLALYGYE